MAGPVVLKHPDGLVGARDGNNVTPVGCSEEALDKRTFLGRKGRPPGGLFLLLQPPAPLLGLGYGIGLGTVAVRRLGLFLTGLLDSPPLSRRSFWRERDWRGRLQGGGRWGNIPLFLPHGVFP